MMPDDTPDQTLRHILATTKVIAAVGVSPNPVRPSNYVARYLHYRRYRVIVINPVAAGKTLFGEPILSDFSEIPDDVHVDMIDVFRQSNHVPAIYDAARQHLGQTFKTFWMQFGVHHARTARRARADGITVVQDRCPKLEHQRLSGELRKAGIATGLISSRLPAL